MAKWFRHTATSAVLCLALPGCSFLNEAVWPSLVGTAPPPVIEADADTTPPPVEPPLATSTDQIEAGLDAVDRQLTALNTRMPEHEKRVEDLRAILGDQAGRVETPPKVEGESQFDKWASAQIELSRLNQDIDSLVVLVQDVAADAAGATVVLTRLQPLRPHVSLGEDISVRFAQTARYAEATLVRIGEVSTLVSDELKRWRTYAQAQSDEIGSQQQGQLLDLDEITAGSQTGGDSSWPDSGDRFKGRKPLATLDFSDPNVAYADQLVDLLGRVQAQYPDIAFDIEVIDAPDHQVEAIIKILKAHNIKTMAYRTMRAPDDPPLVRLYPR